MRSTITKLIYELYGGDLNVDLTPALAVSELSNFNAYLDNLIFDNKMGIWNDEKAREKVCSITITSGIFREISEKAVLDINTTDENRIRILQSLSECMAQSYIGQKLDLEMTIDKIDNFKDDESYLRAYLNKSKLQSGSLYGLSAEIGAILAGADEKQIETAEKLGQTIGLGIHVSNDLGDFAIIEDDSTGFKQYQDQLADLKNGRLSFPIFYVLKHGNEQEKESVLNIVGNNEATVAEQKKAAEAIHTSGAFEFGKSLIRRYYKRAKKIIHENFPESKNRDILSAIPSSIISNKYLSTLKKLNPEKI